MTGLAPIWVLRHGETEWNRAGRMQGVLDSPLTDLGRAQARALGILLTGEGVTARSHRFVCSPQGRARATADIALADIGARVEVIDDLAEIDVGDWTGLARAEFMAGRQDLEALDWLELYGHAPGGEGFDALWARVGRVLDAVDGPTVMVTHGVTSRALRTRAMGWDIDRLAELPGGQGVIHHVAGGRHRQIGEA